MKRDARKTYVKQDCNELLTRRWPHLDKPGTGEAGPIQPAALLT